MKLCKDCVCQPVCSIYRATGGVAVCEYRYVEKVGQWITKWHLDPDGDYKLFHCSLCDVPNARLRRYCTYCGARMKNGEAL